VSKNDNCRCAGTAKVAVKVMGRSAWRPWNPLYDGN